MLQQPTNITPSSFGVLGNGVVDVSTFTQVTWQINGDSPLYAYRIDFYKADATSGSPLATTGKVTLSTPVWGRDFTGEYVPYTASIGASIRNALTNGYAAGYVLTICQWYGSASTAFVEQIQPSYFITRAVPTVAITAPANPYTQNNITLSATYSQAQGDTLNWFRWVITDQYSNTLHDSGKVYGTGNIQVYYDGLFTDQTYYATVEIETSSGQTASSATTINVSYETISAVGQIGVQQGDAYLRVSWDSLQQIYGDATGPYTITDGTLDLPSGSNVTWDKINGAPYSFPAPLSWAWSGTLQRVATTRVFGVYGTSSSVEYYIGDNAVKVYVNGTLANTVNVPTGAGDTFMMAQSRTNLYISRYYPTGGLMPSNSLTPSNTLTPLDTDAYATTSYTATVTDQQFAITSVKTYGPCYHHYIWIVKGNFSADQISALQDIPNEPAGSADDVFLCTFDNSLNAGNLASFAGAIEGWRVYRQEEDNTSLKLIADVPVTQEFINDFGAVSQTNYTYYIFPYGSDIFITSPLIAPTYMPVWWCYALVTATPEDDGYTYTKVNSYKFGLNVSTAAMSNNNTPNVLQNFTGVPYVQISPDNYLSGSLTAYIGSVKDNSYSDTIALRDAIMALSTYTGALFLKDRKGDIIRVRPNGPISMQVGDRYREQPYTVTFPWVQVEAGDNFSVIGTTEETGGN